MRQPLTDRGCAELFRALADETRLRILHALFRRELCVGGLEEELGLGQSLVSHHLKILKNAGLVEARREGQRICYALHPQARDRLSQAERERLDLGCCEVTFRR